MIKLFKKLRKLGLLKRSTISVIIISLIFQRIFRVSSRFPYLVHYTNLIAAPKGIHLYGDGVQAERCLALNTGIYLQGSNGINIHRSVLIAPGVKIISGNHDLNDFSKSSVYDSPINIMENCWIGANAIILPGVILKQNTIVAAGCVVTKSFKTGSIIVGGIPAKIIRVVESK